MMRVRARQRFVLIAVDDEDVTRVRWEYRVVVRRFGHVELGEVVSATVYSLEAQGLLVLHLDGRIDLTDAGRAVVSEVRERETGAVSADHS